LKAQLVQYWLGLNFPPFQPITIFFIIIKFLDVKNKEGANPALHPSPVNIVLASHIVQAAAQIDAITARITALGEELKALNLVMEQLETNHACC